MNKRHSTLILSALLACSAAAFTPAAFAQAVTIVGAVSKIQLAPDGKSAIATLKDNKSGDAIPISISDDLTLDKFKDKRIVVGDEIRTRFEKNGGKNDSKSFKKTAGC